MLKPNGVLVLEYYPSHEYPDDFFAEMEDVEVIDVDEEDGGKKGGTGAVNVKKKLKNPQVDASKARLLPSTWKDDLLLKDGRFRNPRCVAKNTRLGIRRNLYIYTKCDTTTKPFNKSLLALDLVEPLTGLGLRNRSPPEELSLSRYMSP